MNKTIDIPDGEKFWDEKNERFLYTTKCTAVLEHSLFTIFEWEQKHKKRFLDPDVEKTNVELIDYVNEMIQNKDEVGEAGLAYIVNYRQKDIDEYINDKHTATILPKNEDKKDSEKLSSELIYYWMFSSGIDKSCEHWHISNLLTLIGVFGVKNAPEKKESQRAIMERNRALHEKRKREREERLKKEQGECKT